MCSSNVLRRVRQFAISPFHRSAFRNLVVQMTLSPCSFLVRLYTTQGPVQIQELCTDQMFRYRESRGKMFVAFVNDVFEFLYLLLIVFFL